MNFRVEPTGCCEKGGFIQVRYCLYLDESDYKYDRHNFPVYVIPKDGYPGEVYENGDPVDAVEYEKWIKKQPIVRIRNPFHNHFCYFEPTVTDEEILFVGEIVLQKAKQDWEKDNIPNIKNDLVVFDFSSEKKVLCLDRLEQIKSTELKRV